MGGKKKKSFSIQLTGKVQPEPHPDNVEILQTRFID
jgi:hypothetical protein